MPLFRTREERRARRAERKRNRADRKRRRANELDRRAGELSPSTDESATIIATNGDGKQVKQDVLLRKEASAWRTNRIKQLEAKIEELDEQNESLVEDIKELEEQLEEVMELLETRQKGGQLLSKGFLGAANAIITFINVDDGVVNKSALVASEALDALVDLDQLDAQQKDWARLGRVVLKAAAYFDPKVGLRSILESEKKS